MNGFKLVDGQGLPFFTKDSKYRLKTGETLVESKYDGSPTPGQGLHFNESLEGCLYYGTEALCAFDHRGLRQALEDGVRVFEVQADPNNTVTLYGDKMKTRSLKVGQEVDLNTRWPELLEAGNRNVMLVLGASLSGPALAGLVKVRETADFLNPALKTYLNEGLQLNPNNPDRIRPGDTVELDPAGDTFMFAGRFQEARVDRIQDGLATLQVGDSTRDMPLAKLVKKGSVEAPVQPIHIQETAEGSLIMMRTETFASEYGSEWLQGLHRSEASVDDERMASLSSRGLETQALTSLADSRLDDPKSLVQDGWRLRRDSTGAVGYSLPGPDGKEAQHLTITPKYAYLNTYTADGVHQIMVGPDRLVRSQFTMYGNEPGPAAVGVRAEPAAAGSLRALMATPI